MAWSLTPTGGENGSPGSTTTANGTQQRLSQNLTHPSTVGQTIYFRAVVYASGDYNGNFEVGAEQLSGAGNYLSTVQFAVANADIPKATWTILKGRFTTTNASTASIQPFFQMPASATVGSLTVSDFELGTTSVGGADYVGGTLSETIEIQAQIAEDLTTDNGTAIHPSSIPVNSVKLGTHVTDSDGISLTNLSAMNRFNSGANILSDPNFEIANSEAWVLSSAIRTTVNAEFPNTNCVEISPGGSVSSGVSEDTLVPAQPGETFFIGVRFYGTHEFEFNINLDCYDKDLVLIGSFSGSMQPQVNASEVGQWSSNFLPIEIITSGAFSDYGETAYVGVTFSDQDVSHPNSMPVGAKLRLQNVYGVKLGNPNSANVYYPTGFNQGTQGTLTGGFSGFGNANGYPAVWENDTLQAKWTDLAGLGLYNSNLYFDQYSAPTGFVRATTGLYLWSNNLTQICALAYNGAVEAKFGSSSGRFTIKASTTKAEFTNSAATIYTPLHAESNIVLNGGSHLPGSLWKSGANTLISTDTGGLYVNNSSNTVSLLHLNNTGFAKWTADYNQIYGSFNALTQGYAYHNYQVAGANIGYIGQGNAMASGADAAGLGVRSEGTLTLAANGGYHVASINLSGLTLYHGSIVNNQLYDTGGVVADLRNTAPAGYGLYVAGGGTNEYALKAASHANVDLFSVTPATTYVNNPLTMAQPIRWNGGGGSAPAMSANGDASMHGNGAYGSFIWGQGTSYDVVLGYRTTGFALGVVANSNNIRVGGSIIMSPAEGLYLDGANNTYIREVTDDYVQVVAGGSPIFSMEQGNGVYSYQPFYVFNGGINPARFQGNGGTTEQLYMYSDGGGSGICTGPGSSYGNLLYMRHAASEIWLYVGQAWKVYWTSSQQVNSLSLVPSAGNSYDLGTNTSIDWRNAYVRNGVTTGSDISFKKDVTSIDPEIAYAIMSKARSVSYKLIDGGGSEFSHGFIAQELLRLFRENGVDPLTSGVFNYDDKQNRWGLRYQQLIPWMAASNQYQETLLTDKITAQQAQITSLMERMDRNGL